MRNLKTTFAAAIMMAALALGTSSVNAGIIIAGFGETKTSTPTRTEPCTQNDTKVNWGIIIAGVGIIIAGFTGIIIAGAHDEPTVNCGIIIAGKEG
jgi:hypothetical protein